MDQMAAVYVPFSAKGTSGIFSLSVVLISRDLPSFSLVLRPGSNLISSNQVKKSADLFLI